VDETEFVELRVRVPKKVVEFARACLLKGRPEGEYWTNTVMRAVGADADDEGYLVEHEDVLERYGLSKDVFTR